MKTLQIWNLLKRDLTSEVVEGANLYNNVNDDACEAYFNRTARKASTGMNEVRPAVKWFVKGAEYFAEIDHSFCIGVRFANNSEAREALQTLREAQVVCKMDNDMKTVFSYVCQNDYKKEEFSRESEFKHGTNFVEKSYQAKVMLQQFRSALQSK